MGEIMSFWDKLGKIIHQRVLITGRNGYEVEPTADGKIPVDATVNVDIGSVTATDVTIKDATNAAQKLKVNADGSVPVQLLGSNVPETQAIPVKQTGNIVEIIASKSVTVTAGNDLVAETDLDLSRYREVFIVAGLGANFSTSGSKIMLTYKDTASRGFTTIKIKDIDGIPVTGNTRRFYVDWHRPMSSKADITFSSKETADRTINYAVWGRF